MLCRPWRWVLCTCIWLCCIIACCYISSITAPSEWKLSACPVLFRYGYEAGQAPELILSLWWIEHYLILPWMNPWFDFIQPLVKSIISKKHKLLCQKLSLNLNEQEAGWSSGLFRMNAENLTINRVPTQMCSSHVMSLYWLCYPDRNCTCMREEIHTQV